MRIGIDVGGTHTDAVLLRGDDVIASHKALTSTDVTSGILEALAKLMAGGVDRLQLDAVMIGTTQFTNAVVERQRLAPVAAIRLALPTGEGLPAMTGWPADVASHLGGHSYALHGGFLFDGQPLAPIDEGEIDAVIRDLRAKQIRAVAVTSAFSPMNAEPELHVARRIRAVLPDVRITLSHRIGRVGLLERENAALLNASLLEFAATVVAAFEAAVTEFGCRCPIFVSQNDGTLMELAFAREYPALTFASGPTNSLRGAARLTGLADAIVIDIGGTTSDVGVLQRGFPRQSNTVVELGGVRTNFRMPDILSIGLGGGSLVSDGGRTIGPRSVGHRLVSEGMVFGGTTLTATDLAVAAGRAVIGQVAAVAGLDGSVIKAGMSTMRQMLTRAIVQMKPSSAPLPIVLVGGGAVLAPDDLGPSGMTYRPAHGGVANAIGAAIAQIGGESERFVSYVLKPRQQAIADVVADATAKAVAAGAVPASIGVADIEEVAIPYMENGAHRVRVKVIGDIAAVRRAAT